MSNTIALAKDLVIAMEEAIASIDAGMHLGASVTLGEALWKNRAAIAALEAQPQPSAQGPKEIFLQLHGDCLPHETDLPVVYTDDSVTWCWHRINDSDVRYIRADLAALQSTAAQGQDAAPAEQPQDDEPTWQELEDFRKRHWTHWNAADNLLIAHLAQKLKCAARAKE